MAGMIFVDVEAGENCPYPLQQVFSALEVSRPVSQVRLYEDDQHGALYDVVGWANNGPCPAQGAKVEDSGQGHAYLIYGGEEGLRFRPSGSAEPWNLAAADQRGEASLLLADDADIVWGMGSTGATLYL